MKILLHKYKRFLFTLLLVLSGGILLYALLFYQSHMPSLFFVDLSVSTDWYIWSLNSLGLILVYFLGLSAFIIPFFFFYLAYVTYFSLWRVEWDRLISFIVFIGAVCLFATFFSGVVFHGLLLKGGVLGEGLNGCFNGVEDQVIKIAAFTFLLASFVILTRLLFCVPVYYIIRFVRMTMKKNSVVRKFFRSMKNIAQALIQFVVGIYKLISGTYIEKDPHVLFNDEQLEQLSSLDDVVNDVIWGKNKKVMEKVKPDEHPEKKAPLYRLPDLTLFKTLSRDHLADEASELFKKQAAVLEEKLARFGIEGKVSAIKRGPVVTCFEYQPKADMKLSRIIALEDDLTLALEATSLRILAPIPGKSVVGFEVSNKKREDVLLSDIIRSRTYESFHGILPLVLGRDTVGKELIIDLAHLPHLLVAGSTGSGKSVALNVMLTTLLCRKTPDELKLILIDPKRLEFSAYADIPHLLFPIVTMPKRAIQVLQWAVKTMEERYELMAQKGVRSINDYHIRFGESAIKEMPYIVMVIDELADLMMTAGKQVEEWLARIAQMARAAGIHMIVATQRPSVDVITGLIKVNFTSRISFRVTSKVDSRTILDAVGAEKLLGRGDMLFLDPNASLLQRAHGAYVSDEEISNIVKHIQAERAVEYLQLDQVLNEELTVRDEDDEIFKEVLKFLDEVDEISISLLQRKFRIGYNRSARIIEALELHGFIMSGESGKTRKVIRTE
ncbi:TPA: cell division protein FtsK [Candidatus Dependentiae bacterium]|nr:MAG: Cell division protein FtsK/SpoIIIE [candidate division TM6 bacterium GW2011_GWF2_36_131]KKQ02585.1 MAG: Cell division protein FtsK/SpoIIIE [candidate division TM6 bacterium GW2011_GWE2_36_25]KKQ19079.1 MAG: Cell division protein FtsK/SpoIIIE [candidate division TM6 bacterium GW2011_GWA2_36_9]HBR70170.1 cell division protein FtsK [Candidatus Dependentiae bacterium]HCU00098.1 cell division protein FtsK [Candidatus Dependentiae bacterium]